MGLEGGGREEVRSSRVLLRCHKPIALGQGESTQAQDLISPYVCVRSFTSEVIHLDIDGQP